MKTEMIYLQLLKTFMVPVLMFAAVSAAPAASADDIVQQWQQGLKGTMLTAYSGSVSSSNSTLTTVIFCSDGRYSYNREGSWSVPGTAGGASNNTITGRWEVLQNANTVMLKYITDHGEQGMFPLYLQANGRVNIGGTAFAVQQGGAGC